MTQEQLAPKMKNVNSKNGTRIFVGILAAVGALILGTSILAAATHIAQKGIHETTEAKEDRIRRLMQVFYRETLKPDLRAMEERLVREISTKARKEKD